MDPELSEHPLQLQQNGYYMHNHAQADAWCGRVLQEQLAQAAYHCGAHARALQYYEQHLRAAKGNKLNSMVGARPMLEDAEVSFLQASHSVQTMGESVRAHTVHAMVTLWRWAWRHAAALLFMACSRFL